jgi:hypothetical protein
MKMILKSAIAVAALASAAAIIPLPASAGVGVSVGIGVPGPGYAPYGPGYVSYDNDYYYDPIYISGSWYHGPYRWRMRHGERQFWVHGRWRYNEWRGHAMPNSIEFRNGGGFRDGRHYGYYDADRINARFGATVYDSPYGADYSSYDNDYYYDPIYISGSWYHGPYRWRMENGERMFFVDGRWHRDEWRGGARPNTIMFRNGGSFRDGRNYGFNGADRINARFRSDDRQMRDDRHDDGSDFNRKERDHRDNRGDRQDYQDEGDGPHN